MALRTWREHRLALPAAALASLAGTPAILAAAGVENPWILAGTTAIAPVVVILSTGAHARYASQLKVRDGQRLHIREGCLVLPDGRLPAVRDVTDPVSIGVHRAAPAAGSRASTDPPEYIPRDFDGDLRERLSVGGFVLLVGDSTAGKSRAAFEAVSAVLASHVLICPSDRDSISSAIDRAAQEDRCVVWLDDLERYLGTGGLTALRVGRLLADQGSRVIVATIRAAERIRITADPGGDDATRQASRDIRQVFDLAHPFRVERIFTGDEVKRAETRNRDPRIAKALAHADSYGIAEYLAAGPKALENWQDARSSSEGPHSRGAALVAAAIDIRRAGHTSPLPCTLLSQVHEQYLDDLRHSHAPREPMDQAWAWATHQRLATVALLRPVGWEQVEVFDYLVDVVQRRSGPTARAPEDVVWAALNCAGPADAELLADTAYTQGRYALAEKGWRRSFEARADEDELGPDHPDTLAIRGKLALALHAQGRLEEAEAENRTILKISTRINGFDHDDTLTFRGNLASNLRFRGRLEEAEAEYRAVLEASTRIRGFDHSDTLAIRGNLVGILLSRRRLEEAEAESRAILEAANKVLADDDRVTLTIRGNYAYVLHSRGRLEEAEAEYRAVLEASTRIHGFDHPDTLTFRGNLASNLRSRGRLEEAEAEDRAVLEARSQTLGGGHPDALTTRNNLALALAAQGRLEEAEAEWRVVLEARSQSFGPDHPDTLAIRANLANILHSRGRLEDAEAEHRAVLEAINTSLGPDHPDTLVIRSNLAFDLAAQGRLEEAEAEYRALLNSHARVFGADHLDHAATLTTRNNLALVLETEGRLQEAEAEHCAVLEARARALGPDHPDTLVSRNSLARVQAQLA